MRGPVLLAAALGALGWLAAEVRAAEPSADEPSETVTKRVEPVVARSFSIGGDVGFGSFSGVPTSTVSAALDIREGQLALGLRGRVRLALDPEKPIVRRRDYDEASDYVHILRYLRYERSFFEVTATLSAGETLGATLGHGTLVRDYSNIADPNHLHTGLRLQLAHRYFDLDALVDNIVQPSVIGAHVAARPIPGLQRLSFGASMLLDPRAPAAVLRDSSGQRVIDSTYTLATSDEPLGFAGIDASYRWGDADESMLLPYADFNTSFSGVGLHVGARGQLALGEGPLRLSAHLEYRLASSGYSPSYADTFYDIDRYQAALGIDSFAAAPAALQQTKLGALRAGQYAGHGALAQLGLSAGPSAGVRLGYSYQPGPDANRLWVRATSAPLDGLSLGALVVVRGLGQEASSTAGLAALAEGRYQITDYLYALGQFTRTWALSEQSRSFRPLTAFNIGVGGNFSR